MPILWNLYTPVIKHSNGKSPVSIGNTSSKGSFSIAMLDYQRVDGVPGWSNFLSPNKVPPSFRWGTNLRWSRWDFNIFRSRSMYPTSPFFAPRHLKPWGPPNPSPKRLQVWRSCSFVEKNMYVIPPENEDVYFLLKYIVPFLEGHVSFLGCKLLKNELHPFVFVGVLLRILPW